MVTLDELSEPLERLAFLYTACFILESNDFSIAIINFDDLFLKNLHKSYLIYRASF